jgi:hypothetical protein
MITVFDVTPLRSIRKSEDATVFESEDEIVIDPDAPDATTRAIGSSATNSSQSHAPR